VPRLADTGSNAEDRDMHFVIFEIQHVSPKMNAHDCNILAVCKIREKKTPTETGA
jgi:hypothetical protein